MLLALVVASEVSFGVFLLAGLLVRYVLKRPRTGAVLLMLSPVGYGVVLVFGAFDLAGGGTAELAHVMGAILVSIAVVSGKHHLHELDGWIQRKINREPKPQLTSAQHAAKQRQGWYRRFPECLLALALMAGGYALTGFNAEHGAALVNGMRFWAIILAIDFVWSFSYTIFPKDAVRA